MTKTNRAFQFVHGKGGDPSPDNPRFGHLLSFLENKGTVIYNEYSWGKNRRYKDTLQTGLDEVVSDYNKLLEDHQYVYIIGHSLGGNAIIQLAHKGMYFPDGLILLNPAHNIGTPKFQYVVDWSVKKARELIKEGRGDEPTEFVDRRLGETQVCYGTSKSYLTFFDPNGLCNMYNYDPIRLKHQHFLWLCSKNDRSQKIMFDVWKNISINSKCLISMSDTSFHGADPEVHYQSIVEWYIQNEGETND